jgi:hypothetical protein
LCLSLRREEPSCEAGEDNYYEADDDACSADNTKGLAIYILCVQRGSRWGRRERCTRLPCLRGWEACSSFSLDKMSLNSSCAGELELREADYVSDFMSSRYTKTSIIFLRLIDSSFRFLFNVMMI